MNTLTALIAGPALLMAGLAATQDAVKLSRTYKTDATPKYAVKVNASLSGEEITASCDVTLKFGKLLEKGGASAVCSMRNVIVNLGGNAMNDLTIEDFATDMDSAGMPDRISVNEAEWMYTLALVSGMLPGKELKPGESGDVSWTSKDKSTTIAGKAKLVEVVEKDGARVAKIELDVQLKHGDGQNAKWKSTSMVAVEDGRLLSAEGSAEIDSEGTLKFTVASAK